MQAQVTALPFVLRRAAAVAGLVFLLLALLGLQWVASYRPALPQVYGAVLIIGTLSILIFIRMRRCVR